MKSKKKFLRKVVLSAWLVSMTTVVGGQSIEAGVLEGVTYLQGQTQDAWITQALVAAGQVDVPTDHLSSVSGILATDYAKTILALAAAGEDPTAFGSIDYVAKLKTYHSNNQMGDENLLNDDFWSVLALASVDEINSTESQNAKNFILANQNNDGGWGYNVGGESDSNDTAAAVMALVEAGVSVSDGVITNAVNYLKSTQNDDGGFGWSQGDPSDSGSDAWVMSAIYKLGQDPVSWTKNSHHPVEHLETLQDTDGGFWWVEPGTSDFNNKAMTTFAVVALAGKTYPVGYWQPNAGKYHLRIEGQSGTMCDVYVEGTTALDVVENGSVVCGYTYNIEDTAYGPYLNQINNETAQGMSGWMYFVNFISPVVGANDYTLQEGDEVLWYYGDWGWMPTRLLVDDNNVESGQCVLVSVDYFDGQNWLDLEGATIKGGVGEYTTDAQGQAGLDLSDGRYELYVEKHSYIRSNREVVLVGQGAAQSVGMKVEIDQTGDGGGGVGGESIVLVVDPDELNFGKLKPGQTGKQDVILSNQGTVELNINTVVTGDELFVANTKINDQVWSAYQTDLNKDQQTAAEVSLCVPSNYVGAGVKSGELIFWARAR